MRPLADHSYNPNLPLQTKQGARQALRCGHNKINELIKSGRLEIVKDLGRVTRITTGSILKLAAGEAATETETA